jgi:hypothetical protein
MSVDCGEERCYFLAADFGLALISFSRVFFDLDVVMAVSGF